MSHDNVWEGLLEQRVFRLLPDNELSDVLASEQVLRNKFHVLRPLVGVAWRVLTFIGLLRQQRRRPTKVTADAHAAAR